MNNISDSSVVSRPSIINQPWAKVLSLLVALVLVNIQLLAPEWILAGHPEPTWIAIEAVFVVGVFAILPRARWTSALAFTAATTLILVSAAAFADTIMRQSLARPLNLYLDLHLVSAGYRLMTGTLGLGIAILIVIAMGLVGLLATWIVTVLLSPVELSFKQRLMHISGLGILVLVVTVLAGNTASGVSGRLGLPAVEVVTAQARHLARMLNERDVFATEIAAAPRDYARLPGLLSRLQDRDVVVAFVESYGISALHDPRYAPVILPRLHDLATRVTSAQLYLVTGTLVAPTQGGQSWFSHLSLVSGLWVNNQLRYDLLLASGRETLIDDFRRAGHRTVALMPANTLAWPEGERLGYDEILNHQDIDYAGPALNWVTMPDQFTWSFLEHTVRTSDYDARPLFAELSLISSHAPWTPILPVLDDWDTIGNGAVFAPWENAGERPQDLWLNLDRVRENFALSLDYAINVVAGYAERYVDDHTLLIVLGDHQPAPLITGDSASRKVPVHVISGDPTLLQPFLAWGFATGGFPDRNQSVIGMDAFRDWFVRTFSVPNRSNG